MTPNFLCHFIPFMHPAVRRSRVGHGRGAASFASIAITAACLAGCFGKDDGPSDSSATNFLGCETVADCDDPRAVACNADGLCLDDKGKPIADSSHTVTGGAGGAGGDTAVAGAGGTGGSGGGAGGAGGEASPGSPSACNARPLDQVPEPAAPDASVQEAAEIEGLRTLDTLFGGIVRGNVVIYRGTGAATDNGKVLGAQGTFRQATDPDGVLPSGNVTASLLLSGGGATPRMLVHSDDATVSMMVIQESPPKTWFFPIKSDGHSEASNIFTYCDDCIDDLSTAPEHLALAETNLANAIMLSPLSGGGTVDLEMTVALDLNSVAACDVTFDDLVPLRQDTPGESGLREAVPAGDEVPLDKVGIPNFVVDGDEWVAHASGTFVVDDPGSPSEENCATTTPYTLDVFVGATNVSYYGVRNVVVGKSKHACTGPLTPNTP